MTRTIKNYQTVVGRRRRYVWLRKADPNARVDITLKLKALKLPSPAAMASTVLTPQQFAGRYGATRANIERVREGTSATRIVGG